jgi:DNA-binding LacI/PurR family transcriptional regulator
MSDEMAFGALGAIWRAGLRVPDDISLIAVDNHEVAAVLGLTTVRQHVSEQGAVAARHLLEDLSIEEGPMRRHEIDVELVERTSTRPPLADG